MKTGAFRRPLRWCARLLLAGVFLAAAWPKIADPAAFALAIFRYRLLPYPAVNLAAVTLPWIELIAALALLAWPRGRTAAAAILLALLGTFTVAVTFTLLRGIPIDCGCFGTGSDAPATWTHVAFNLALTGVAAWTCRAEALSEERSEELDIGQGRR